MTVPNKLVKAAAEALHTLNGCPCGRWPCAEPRYTADALREAGIIVAAAFAVLPECVEAVEAIAGAIMRPGVATSKERAVDGLAALAKWGQP